MSLVEIMEMLRRHLFACAGVLILAGVVGFAVKTAPVSYSESATVIVRAPISAKHFVYVRPGTLIASADIAAQVLQSTSAAQRVKESGGAGDFSVTMVNVNTLFVPGYFYPDLNVSAEGSSAAQTANTFHAVVNEIEKVLHEQQASAQVPPNVSLRIDVAGDTGAVADVGSSIRVDAGLIILTLVGGLVLLRFLDRHEGMTRNLMPRRRPRAAVRLG